MAKESVSRESYEPWREALYALNQCLRESKDKHERAVLLAQIAVIELLIHIKRSLDRVPIQYGAEH